MCMNPDKRERERENSLRCMLPFRTIGKRGFSQISHTFTQIYNEIIKKFSITMDISHNYEIKRKTHSDYESYTS